ncbi:22kda glycoprotein [Fusarium heterosporum]|uniref:22kda glycoprotein n=1 Tax=Fusarium heterosporum TaxID=42747 RepID=A0A8H5ST07_FUSHE|nr:22kda glycoprotein [Fusarium heterosporum]
MKFFATAILSAAAVSGAIFDVKDFSATCIPHSTECHYEFKVIQPGTMETWKHPVHCSATVQSANYLLPNVKNAKCGDDSSRTFSVTRSKKGLNFSVSQPVSPISYTTGKHFIPNKQLWQSTAPNAEIQRYKGPKDFSLN